MYTNKIKNFVLMYGNTIAVVALLMTQSAVLVFLFHFLTDYLSFFFEGFFIVSIILVFYILNDRTNPAYKQVWIILVLLIPIFGSLFYIYIRLQQKTNRRSKRYASIKDETKHLIKYDYTFNLPEKEDQNVSSIFRFLAYAGYPAYENTAAIYFPTGEEMIEEIKLQLEKAQKFIFLEYFLVNCGYMWDSILEILERKVLAGVEVRILYDGMCALFLLPSDFQKALTKKGIKCKMFSPILPALSIYHNNRDHRKMIVIDGHTAFTGGANIADEYINKKSCYGNWKDTSIMLRGGAVTTFTILFLQMWNSSEKQMEDCTPYLPVMTANHQSCGYVLPYGDGPFERENIGEHVYLDIIHKAKRYVHIMTPYLILDSAHLASLTHAAKSGVEIMLILPGIPDKPYMSWASKTYYPELLEAGVRIFEYAPGFIHAKSFVSDDVTAVVGTINLDFRSLYLNFECAVLLYQNPEIMKIEQDFQDTLRQSREITLAQYKKLPLLQKIAGRILRLFSPLL